MASAPSIRALVNATTQMQTIPRAASYIDELAGQNRVNRIAQVGLRKIVT